MSFATAALTRVMGAMLPGLDAGALAAAKGGPGVAVLVELLQDADELGPRQVPELLRRVFARVGDEVGVPGDMLAAVAARTGFDAGQTACGVGLMGIPAALVDDPAENVIDIRELGADAWPLIQAHIAYAAEILAGLRAETGSMAAALTTYCQGDTAAVAGIVGAYVIYSVRGAPPEARAMFHQFLQ